MQFEDLNLIDPLLRAVRAEGYTTPTPIQQQAIPHVLQGRDLLGCAQTGTGKTAAFALPIIQRLTQNPRKGNHLRVLVLAPTRELASQIGDSFTNYGRHTTVKQATIFGGVGQSPQVDALRRHPEVLVAAPGRLLDLMNQGYVKLDKLEVFVLDEADRMLDMGFIHDVRRVIAALPRQRQTLFFSATMPPEIQDLANSILDNPVRVEVTPPATTVELIQQSIYFVEKKEKPALLQHLLEDSDISRVLVFTRTKHGANKVVTQLARVNIHAEAIHGNKSQTAREKALANFKSGRTRVLVATDIAARGLDVDEITHIINYDLPNEPDTYVHRIGRTARAGASGVAYSFCDTEEREYLRDIEKLIRQHVPVVAEHPYRSPEPPPPPTDLNARGGQRSSQPRPQNNQRQQPTRDRDSRPQGEPRRDRRPNGSSRPQGQRDNRDQVVTTQFGSRPTRDSRQQAERRNDQPRNEGSRPQGQRDSRDQVVTTQFGSQPNRDSRPGGERRSDSRRNEGSRPQGQRDNRDQAARGQFGAQPNRDSRPGGERRGDQRRNDQPRPSYDDQPREQRPSMDRPYRLDNRPEYNTPPSSSSPRRDDRSQQAAAPAAPQQPVRRKRPLPPPAQREQPVLTDRFGNPLPMKPKQQPEE